jgi:ribosomal protein S27AE
MAALERPAGSDVQQCPPCGSGTVLAVSLEGGRVWFVCFKCVHRWSIADRRSPSQTAYGGRDRRTRLLH